MVATLAICIGAVAAVYSVVDVVLVRGLPFRRPEQLVWVSSVSRDRPDRPFSLPEFMDYRAQTHGVRVSGYTTWNAIVESASGARRIQGLRMSADGFSILGATPTIGRLLTSDDDAPTAPRVVVLGYGYWRHEFAGDSAVLGRALALNGERVTVVGVLPRFFPVPVRDVDAVVPLDPERDPRRHARGSVNFIRMFGRLETAATSANAEHELNGIAARLRAQFPTEYGAKLGVRVTPLQEYLASTQRATLLILLACVALMVVISFANVLNLILARAVAREGEIAVRLALGASAQRIAMQFLTEGALLVTVAAVIGLACAQLAITYAATHLTAITPRIEEARLDITVLALVVGISLTAVLLFSLVPILIASMVSPQTALRRAGRSGSASPAQARLRSSFVAAEVALALVVTSATAALMRSVIDLQRVELGYRPDSVFVARVSLPPRRYQTPAELGVFSNNLSTALARLPGVIAVGASSIAPLSGVGATIPFAPAQSAPAARRDWPTANFRAVSAGYLGAIGARRVAGRLIAEQDDDAGPPVVVVNRSLAERYFARTGAVGQELLLNDGDGEPRSVRIVGVVDDVRDVDLDGPINPEVFIAFGQINPAWSALVAATQFWAVRVHSDPAAFGQPFVRALHDVDPAVATAGLTGLRSYVDGAIAPRRFSVDVLAAITMVALVLTTLGVYGITAHTVEQRRREIGVRMALGATSRSIVWLILGRTLRLACIGVVAGVAGAVLSGGLMSRLTFGVTPGRPMLLTGVSATLLGTTALASWLAARRATRVDALRALSAE